MIECAQSPTGLHERRDTAGEFHCRHCGEPAFAPRVYGFENMRSADDDEFGDPLYDQRAELARIIIDAQRWGLWARRLFAVALVGVVLGVGLIVAGALKLVGCS